MTFSSRASTHPEKDDAIEYLDAALSSLPCGFSVWDDEFRLILANQRYLDIYRLPADKVHRGMPLEDMVALIVASGNHPGASVADLLPAYRERLLQATDPTSGRSAAVRSKPPIPVIRYSAGSSPMRTSPTAGSGKRRCASEISSSMPRWTACSTVSPCGEKT